MKKITYSSEMKPCLFCESLQVGTIMPVQFGRHLNFVVNGLGAIQHSQTIYVSRAACRGKYMEADLVKLLQTAGYANVRVIADAEPRGSGDYGARGSHRIVGEECQHIG